METYKYINTKMYKTCEVKKVENIIIKAWVEVEIISWFNNSITNSLLNLVKINNNEQLNAYK